MNLEKLAPILIIVLTVLGSAGLKKDIFHLDIQGSHAWRQSQTCINIRNFTRHDFNILNPRTATLNKWDNNIKRVEFPLMQWMIAGVQKMFGESIFMVRMSMFLIHLFTLAGVFLAMNQLFKNGIVAAVGVFIFSFFPVYLYQSINPLPDNFALGLTMYFLYFFFLGIEKEEPRAVFFSALFLGVAGLCKLPFILYGIFPLIYLIKKWKSKILFKTILLSFSLILFPIVSWYYFAIPEWGGNRITFGIFDPTVKWDKFFLYLGQQLSDNIPLVVIGKAQLFLMLLSLIIIIKYRIFKYRYTSYFAGGG